jgi:osmotically-inducible protein OsmY
MPNNRPVRALGKAIETIREEIGAELDAVRITAQIQSAMDVLRPATGLEVNVDTDHGVVYLRGTVASEEQRAAAERIARDVCPRGVVRIVNELQVNPTLPPILFP